MSTLKVNNIGKTTGSTQDTMAGLAKVYVYYNQVTPAVLGSLNVSSVTDNTTGHFTPNYSNNMNDANYSSTGMTHTYHIGHDADNVKTTSAEKFEVYTVSGTGGQRSFSDRTHNCVAIHGDLA